jgi:hypothetical protein
MLTHLRFSLFALMCVIGAGSALAAPITWRASGLFGRPIIDLSGTLSTISIGTPWTLDITFETPVQGPVMDFDHH